MGERRERGVRVDRGMGNSGGREVGCRIEYLRGVTFCQRYIHSSLSECQASSVIEYTPNDGHEADDRCHTTIISGVSRLASISLNSQQQKHTVCSLTTNRQVNTWHDNTQLTLRRGEQTSGSIDRSTTDVSCQMGLTASDNIYIYMCWDSSRYRF